MGWLGTNGKLLPAARSAVLGLRYDARASIETIADYSRLNLDRLKRAGIATGGTVENMSRTAYMAHYMGPGDAIRFLKGQMSEGRARTLLNAQVGSIDAARRISRYGAASLAHGAWLTGHIERNVQPLRYAMSKTPANTG